MRIYLIRLLLKRNELAAKNKTFLESLSVAGECGKKGKKKSLDKVKVNCCKFVPSIYTIIIYGQVHTRDAKLQNEFCSVRSFF